MSGIFRPSRIKNLFSLFFILLGSFLTIRFTVWGIEAVRDEKPAVAVFAFLFALIGLAFGLVSIFLFQFNRKAYLTIGDRKMDGLFGFGTELHEYLVSLRKVELNRGGKGLTLYFTDRICSVFNLQNAKEVCAFLDSRIPKGPGPMTLEEAETTHGKQFRKYILLMVLTILLSLILFGNIGWCVWLTDGKSLESFSQAEIMVFTGFAVAEIITLFILFVLADKCGKQKKICELCYFTCLSAAASEYRNEGLEKYGQIIKVKFFDDYTYRIVIFSAEGNIPAYMLERFDFRTESWVFCFDHAKGFETMSELFDDLEESFVDVLFME